jgi:hypothetical protein
MTVVRSCVLPGQRHDELPPDSYACRSCWRGLVRKLGEVESYLATVTAVPVRSGHLGPLTRQFTSRPPADLTVVSMFDHRTGITGSGPDDRLDEIPNIHADLFGWLRILIAEHPDWLEPPDNLIDSVALLRSRCDWICCQAWVDEFAADIMRVHGALRAACGDNPPRAFAPCPQVVDGDVCGGPLVMYDDGTGAHCRTCRASWRRDQLLDLMLLMGTA